MLNDNTCKFNDDQQGLTPRLSANTKQVDDIYMAAYLLHYLHLLVTKISMMTDMNIQMMVVLLMMVSDDDG